MSNITFDNFLFDLRSSCVKSVTTVQKSLKDFVSSVRSCLKCCQISASKIMFSEIILLN